MRTDLYNAICAAISYLKMTDNDHCFEVAKELEKEVIKQIRIEEGENNADS